MRRIRSVLALTAAVALTTGACEPAAELPPPEELNPEIGDDDPTPGEPPIIDEGS